MSKPPEVLDRAATFKDPGERRAAVWLESLGHPPEKIPEEADKTPDFRVHTSGIDSHFFAEVKTIESPGSDEALLWDPLYNTVSKRIRDSRKQFTAIDPDHRHPRVMIFVSEDMRIHGETLLDFFKGQIVVGHEVVRNLNRFRLGRVAADIGHIDVYVVLDTADSPTFFFTDVDAGRSSALTKLFGFAMPESEP
jgi:hypothetical protein